MNNEELTKISSMFSLAERVFHKTTIFNKPNKIKIFLSATKKNILNCYLFIIPYSLKNYVVIFLKPFPCTSDTSNIEIKALLSISFTICFNCGNCDKDTTQYKTRLLLAV